MPGSGGPLPSFPMGAALLVLRDQLCFLQTLFDPRIAARPPDRPYQLWKCLTFQPSVPAAILIGQRHHFIDRRPPVRDLFQPSVDQPIQSFRLIPRQIPPKAALAHPQYLRRFSLRQPSRIPSFIYTVTVSATSLNSAIWSKFM
jgi:hypothetical protein